MLLAVAGMLGISFGLHRWYKNQKLLDEKLWYDVGLVRIEYKERVRRHREMTYVRDPKNKISYSGQKYPIIANYEPEDT